MEKDVTKNVTSTSKKENNILLELGIDISQNFIDRAQ